MRVGVEGLEDIRCHIFILDIISGLQEDFMLRM